jgi:hypothetical protein
MDEQQQPTDNGDQGTHIYFKKKERFLFISSN